MPGEYPSPGDDSESGELLTGCARSTRRPAILESVKGRLLVCAGKPKGHFFLPLEALPDDCT